MPWQTLSFCCDSEEAVELGNRLTDGGAVSVSMSDASAGETLLEGDPGANSLWRRTRVQGLFSGDAALEGLIARLREAGYPPPSIAPVRDDDWENAWRQHVTARRYGERLWVLPSFADASPGQEICVRLDPGLAFGTGAHPTTALCLEWLDRNVRTGVSVIDYGCGSGILAIAAAKLGAARVRAVDTDPQALGTARDNAGDNACDGQIAFFAPSQLPRYPADLLVANLFANALVDLCDEFAGLVRAGGCIALSGILAGQADAVKRVYEHAFELEPSAVRENWVRISGRRRFPGPE